MTAPSRFEGGCSCGSVRFEITPPTRWCVHCHCRMCRIAHGAPFVTWFGIKRTQFRVISGDDILHWHVSSDHGRRAFCRDCGTQMLFETTRHPDQLDVVRACVPGDIDRAPSAHVHVASKVSWVDIDDSLDQYVEDSGSEKISP